LRQNHVYLDGNFASLVATVIVGEGLGRRMLPQFNMFRASAPYLIQYLDATEVKELSEKLQAVYGLQMLQMMR